MHGTLCLEGEVASAKWSTTIADKRKTQPFEITTMLFWAFWRAMDTLPEVKKGWVPDLGAKPDLSKHNITAMVVDASNPTKPLFERRHVIPTESASDQLRDLLLMSGLGSCK
jgi:hypothetical protein